MLKNRFRVLATAGVAAVFALGLSACNPGVDSDPSAGGEDTSQSDRCYEVTNTSTKLHDNISSNAIATVAPVGVDGTSPHAEIKNASEWSDSTYLVGWRNSHTVDPVTSLEDVVIATHGSYSPRDCTIIPLSGGKITEDNVDGDKTWDQGWDLFTFTGDAATPESKGYLSFVNPYDEDSRVVIPLWNLSSDSTHPHDKAVALIRAAGDTLEVTE